jgi:hypothetical protein
VGLGKASVRFLSAAPTSNVRGETANLLLVANEAQDIDADRWDAVFDPMAASTNAPTLFLGTVWTARTLLARQMRYLRELEAADGQQRVFLVDWQTVAQHVPSYGARVEAQIRQFGRLHPFIQTEYFLRELDGSGGLFHSERLALMQGSHPRRTSAEPGKIYALLVDVAGEAEQATGEVLRAANPRKDSTAVTIVEIEQGSNTDEHREPQMNTEDFRNGFSPSPILHTPSPIYKIVNRYVWTGTPHTELYERIVSLARETWWAKYIVVDATGVGAPLAAFLQKALGKRTVIPFVFSSASKSKLGYDFCGIVDGGRYKEYAPDGAADTAWFWRQVGAVEYRVRQGPTHVMSWGVPNPTVHDDLVMSAALVAVLDGLDWRPRKAVGVS